MLYETRAFKRLPFQVIHEILRRSDPAFFTVLDVFEAIDGWVTFAEKSSDAASENSIRRRKIEARYLFQLKIDEMGWNEIKTLAKGRWIRTYPHLLLDFIASMDQKSDFTTFRYDPALSQKRFIITLDSTLLNIGDEKSTSQVDEATYTQFDLKVTRGPVICGKISFRLSVTPR